MKCKSKERIEIGKSKVKEKLLKSKLYGEPLSIDNNSKCGGKLSIHQVNGGQHFSCESITNKKTMNRCICVKDHGIHDEKRDAKLKDIIRCVLCPEYRRSSQISRYIEKGYTHQEALARANVIETI